MAVTVLRAAPRRPHARFRRLVRLGQWVRAAVSPCASEQVATRASAARSGGPSPATWWVKMVPGPMRVSGVHVDIVLKCTDDVHAQRRKKIMTVTHHISGPFEGWRVISGAVSISNACVCTWYHRFGVVRYRNLKNHHIAPCARTATKLGCIRAL